MLNGPCGHETRALSACNVDKYNSRPLTFIWNVVCDNPSEDGLGSGPVCYVTKRYQSWNGTLSQFLRQVWRFHCYTFEGYRLHFILQQSDELSGLTFKK